MTSRQKLLEVIGNERGEIKRLEAQIKKAEIYVHALEEALRLLPTEAAPVMTAGRVPLRASSFTAKAREAILAAGAPLHIGEIVAAIGKKNNYKNRASVAGTLNKYARKKIVFFKTAPNTFGLLELAPERA